MATSSVFPFFGYDDAATAIDWLEQAFGFERGDVHMVQRQGRARGALVRAGWRDGGLGRRKRGR